MRLAFLILAQGRNPARRDSSGNRVAKQSVAMKKLARELAALLLARLQWAFTISLHIIFPAFTIGVAASLTVLEAMRLRFHCRILIWGRGQIRRQVCRRASRREAAREVIRPDGAARRGLILHGPAVIPPALSSSRACDPQCGSMAIRTCGLPENFISSR